MALHKLKYGEAVTEACSRVNDPDKDTYGDRAGELFYEGVVTLVKSGKAGPDEVPGLFQSMTVLAENFISGPTNMRIIEDANDNTDLRLNIVDTGESCIRLISIMDDYEIAETGSGTVEHKYIPISIMEYRQMIDPEMRPFEDEIYYYRAGDFVRFYPANGDTGLMTNQRMIVNFIKHPKEFGDEDDLTGSFSLDFVYQIINYIVAQLRMEIAGE